MFISKEELNRRLSNSNNVGPDAPNSKTTPSQRHSTTSTTPNPPQNPPLPPLPPDPRAQQAAPITSCINSLLDKDKDGQTATSVRSSGTKSTLNSLSEQALEKTLQALGMITPDKLMGLSAEKLSRIASNTSKIIDNCREDKDILSGINITIYSPEQKSESSYKVIDVAR